MSSGPRVARARVKKSAARSRAAAASAAQRAGSPGLRDVTALLSSAEKVARELGYPDPPLRKAYHRQIMMLLSQAYVQVFGTSVESPDWVPHTGPLFPWGAPNHDTIYGFAPIDAMGTYRVAGTKGTESIASLMFRQGGPNTGQVHGATLGEIDMQAVETDRDGRFSLLISAQRPAGYDGLWHALPPETTGLVARHVTEEPSQQDGVWSLQRLDREASRASTLADATDTRLENMTRFAQRLNEFLLRLIVKLRHDGYTNVFVGDRFQGHGGIAAQMYYQGLFELGPDEALVLESEVPATVHYWSVQLVDPFYSAIDFIFHSAAFNGRQARISADGKARFVVSSRDPAVPNWLDSAGWHRGGMLWRWHMASSLQVPTVRRVRLSRLRRHLPADTPTVEPAQRALERAARIAHYQSRRRW